MPVKTKSAAPMHIDKARDGFARYTDVMMGDRLNVTYLHDNYSIKFANHHHGFYELLFILSGELSYEVEGRRYELKSGDIMLINLLEFHQAEIFASRPYERYVVWLHPDQLSRWEKLELNLNLRECFEQCTVNHNNLLRLDREEFARFVRLLRELWHERPQPGAEVSPHKQALFESLGLELLVRLNQAYQNPLTLSSGMSKFDDPRMTQVVDYINENLGSDLSLDTLAARFHVSKFYLTRLFKEFTGQSLHQFVIGKRALQGKYLIERGMPPSRAALETGFADYSSFARNFKRLYNTAPSDFCPQ